MQYTNIDIKSSINFNQIILIILLINLVGISYAGIGCSTWVHSTLSPSAVNQYGYPLENTTFYIRCNSLKSYNNNNEYICTSGPTGTCNTDQCFNCCKTLDAYITANYYSSTNEKTVDWEGETTNCHSSIPYVQIEPFGFYTTKLSFDVNDPNGNPLENATVTVTFPNTPNIMKCKTNSKGKCILDKVMMQDSYTYSLNYNERNYGGIITTPKDIYKKSETENVIPVTIVPDINHWQVNIDLTGPYEEAYELYIDAVPTEDRFLELETGTYKFSVKAMNKTIYSKTYLVEENMEINIDLTPDNCQGSCALCGCPNNQVCSYSSSQNNFGCCDFGKSWNGHDCMEQSKYSIYFVGINPNSPSQFINVAKDLAGETEKYIPFGYGSYRLVPEPLIISKNDCNNQNFKETMRNFFNEWYVNHYGYDTRFPDWESFRVVYVDLNNSCQKTSCGYTWRTDNFYIPIFDTSLSHSVEPIYINYAGCGSNSHVLAHEIGHTFNLCDDYNPNTWDNQNNNYPCPNEKPTSNNSNILGSCETNPVCTYGVLYNDGKYSVMGSGNIIDQNGQTINRRFGIESKTQIMQWIYEVNSGWR